MSWLVAGSIENFVMEDGGGSTMSILQGWQNKCERMMMAIDLMAVVMIALIVDESESKQR